MKDWAYPAEIKDVKDVDTYLRHHYEQHVEESQSRVEDFEDLEIDTLTVSEWTIQTSFKPSADATVDLGAVGATDYRFRHLYLSGNLSDETNTLTVANAKSAYDHISANGSSHSYIDQSVVSGANVTFGTIGSNEITVADGHGINLQEDITFTGATTENLIKMPDDLLDALSIQEGSNKYVTFDTVDDEEDIFFYKSVDILHTATHATDHALEIDTDAAMLGDVKALDIDYITGQIDKGQDEGIILINIDETAADGGEVFGLEVLSTDGSASIHGIKVGPVVHPVHQDSGIFIDPTLATDSTPTTHVADMADHNLTNTTAIFEAYNEYIIIGANDAFQDMELVFTTVSSKDIRPTFEYSTSGIDQFTEFTPVDGTDGCRHTGVISWDASDLSGHVADNTTGKFDIKITRTKAGSMTTPVLGYAKTAKTVEYVWDKNGDVSIRNLGVGTATWGTSAVKVFGIGGSVAPTTSPADMVQLWSADRSAGSANLYYRAEGGLARPLGREFDVSDYGLVPDDNSGSIPGDNVTAFDTLIGKMGAGDVMYFPKGVWYINDDLDVTQAGITIRGDGINSEIQQEVTAKMGFDITVSDVTIRDLRLRGYDAPASAVSGANAIYAHGADSSNYISNIKVTDCFIFDWEMYGIYSLFVEQFEYRDNNIKTVTYAGIMGLSVRDGHIYHNYIDDIKCSTGHSNNGYGIALSRLGGNSLASQPRSARVLVDHNIIKNVTLWEGLDSHSGEQITFDSNQTHDCMYGIIVTGSTDEGASQVIAKDINIINNLCDATGLTVGAAGAGIVLSNASTDGVTGTIIGNIIKDHGYESNVVTTPSGALQIYHTAGVVIQGNEIFNPAPCGIVIMHTSTGFVCSGNTISNPWTDTADNGNGHARGIYVGGSNNTGHIGENTIVRGTDLSKTYELDTAAADDGRAIEVANSAGNVIILGTNYSEATTYLTDAGVKAVNYSADILINNNLNIKFKDVGGAYQNVMSLSSGDDLELGTGANIDDVRLCKNTKVGVNAAPAAALDVYGDGIFGGVGDTTKVALHNASVEAAYLQIDSNRALVIDADSVLNFQPANTLAVTFLADGGVKMVALKSGANQGAAGASENELWHDTDDDTIKLGAST